MIRRADEMILELKEQMRGGAGTVEITHLFKQDELTGKARLIAKVVLKPGCSIGLHPHDTEEEIYYIIKGNGQVNDNGEVRDIAAGDAMLTGGGAVHSIENTGTEPLEFMAVILLF